MATRVKTVKILLSYSISHRSVADNNTKLSVNNLFFIVTDWVTCGCQYIWCL